MTVAVIGLGGMGSAALFHLARRGVRAIGFEQFGPAHARGASHGRSRIIRRAYFEDARYVPLLQRAYELWNELDAAAIEPVWNRCGGVTIAAPQSALVQGTVAAARTYGIEHDVFDRREAEHRFPAFRLKPDEVAVYEPSAGALIPERCVAEHLRRAVDAGAQARFGTAVRTVEERGNGIVVTTSEGERVECDGAVVTAGPWIRTFFDVPVRVERNVQHWFRPSAPPERIFMVDRPEWTHLFYGFPDFGEGVKAAFHHSGEFIGDAACHDESTRADEIESVRGALEGVLAAGAGEYVRSEPCMYAVTPDEYFLIGKAPDRLRTVFAGGFSGHGFKFCSVVGEILAQLAVGGATSHDISLFAPRRFTGTAPLGKGSAEVPLHE